jgi:hypothetical protein
MKDFRMVRLTLKDRTLRPVNISAAQHKISLEDLRNCKDPVAVEEISP